MKRIVLALILVLTLSLYLISCGGEKPSDEAGSNKSVAGIETVLGGEAEQESLPEEKPVKKAATVNKESYPVAENMTWTFDSGILTISGNGRMPDYNFSSEWPWCDYRKNTTKIVIEEGITSVGSSAFYEFYKVKDIELPSSLVFIDSCGFAGCSSLKEIILPEGLLSVGQSGFGSCFEVAEILLPSTLLRIEENAFSECDKTTFVAFPEGLQFLGESAFYSTPLTEVTLPKSLVEIEQSVFGYCYSLNTITLNCEVDMPNIFTRSDKIETVNCGDYYVYENGILYNKDKTLLIGAIDETITQLEIPETVTKISDEAFAYTNLSSLTIPANVKQIGEAAFSSCKNLSSVTVENGLETVDKFAFAYCESLTQLDFPESVKSTAYGSFRGCSANVNFASPKAAVDFNEDDASHSSITVTFAE